MQALFLVVWCVLDMSIPTAAWGQARPQITAVVGERRLGALKLLIFGVFLAFQPVDSAGAAPLLIANVPTVHVLHYWILFKYFEDVLVVLLH